MRCLSRVELEAGLPDGLFSNFGKIRRALEWKMLLYFMTIWNISQPFGIFMSLW
jgi:hypothetical protein